MKRAALVTGGAKRIGRAIALRLADEGYDIILHYASSGSDAERTAEDLRGRSVECHTLRADLADNHQVLELIPRAVDLAKGLNVLVNNASIFQRSPIAETETGLYDDHMAINLRAPFFLLREFAARCGDGQVINLLDTRIVRDESAYAAYTLSKKSLAELTRMAAREFAPRFRVNAVAPGLILPSPDGSEDQFERMAGNIPLQTTGGPEQIADAVVFLLRSEFITGEVIHVDGGEHLL